MSEARRTLPSGSLCVTGDRAVLQGRAEWRVVTLVEGGGVAQLQEDWGALHTESEF